jgi:fatty acid kinase fatty acid binding subunit
MIKIVTDTAVSLPPEVIREFEITILGGHIHFGEEKFADYFEMGPDEFYQRLTDSRIPPTYEDPSPDAFRVIYRSLLQRYEGIEILSLHCTSKMASTMGAARYAAASFPGVSIRLFDTLSVGAAQGLMVWEAAHLAAAHAEMNDILARLEHMREHTKLFFTLDTLEFVARSGRVGPLERVIGNLLNIKPVLTIQDGMIELHSQQRTRAKALASLRDLALGECLGQPHLRMGVMHAACEGDARELADDLKRVLHPEVMLVSPLSAGVGANAGPGALGVCWYSPDAEKRPS